MEDLTAELFSLLSSSVHLIVRFFICFLHFIAKRNTVCTEQRSSLSSWEVVGKTEQGRLSGSRLPCCVLACSSWPRCQSSVCVFSLLSQQFSFQRQVQWITLLDVCRNQIYDKERRKNHFHVVNLTKRTVTKWCLAFDLTGQASAWCLEVLPSGLGCKNGCRSMCT